MSEPTTLLARCFMDDCPRLSNTAIEIACQDGSSFRVDGKVVRVLLCDYHGSEPQSTAVMARVLNMFLATTN